jgi:hypothetical protein
MKKKLILISTFLMALLGISFPVHATVYYVDGSIVSNCTGNYSITNRSCSGSDGNAYKTVQAGINAAASAGDIVYIRAGTYGGAVSSANSGRLGSQIIISRYSSETVNLTSTGVSTTTLSIVHNNITIDGLRFTGTGSWQYYPIVQIGTDAAKSTGNIIKNCYFSGGTVNTYGLAIYANGAIAEYNEFVGPSMFIGVTVFGNDNILRNNTFHDISGNERIFDVCSGARAQIKNNTVYNLTEGNGAHLDFVQYVGSGMGSSCTSHTDGVIEGNLLYASPALQILTMEPGDSTGYACAGWKVINNLFINTAAIWAECRDTLIANNTFYSEAGTEQPAIWYSGTSLNKADNLTIKNNLFIGHGGSSDSTGWYQLYPGGSVSGLVADYNYVTKPPTRYLAKTGFSEAHGINGGNPLFTNPAVNDFTLQSSSPAINKGTDLSVYFTKDRAGNTRSGTWSIGAYEFGSRMDPTQETIGTPVGLKIIP